MKFGRAPTAWMIVRAAASEAFRRENAVTAQAAAAIARQSEARKSHEQGASESEKLLP